MSCAFDYRGETLRFNTDAGVFSKGEIDFGTRVLLDALPELKGRVLDLGCGYGAVGVSVGKKYGVLLTMSDVNLRALSLARENAGKNGVQAEIIESDGLQNIKGRFDYILLNPPIRAGKAVIYALFASCAGRLTEDGALYVVIRKQQGAQSAVQYLKTLFQTVETVDKSGGFWVLECKGGHEDEV